MKTLLIMVGKTVNKHFVAGINDYCERISHYMPFDTLVIPELKNTRKLTEEQQKHPSETALDDYEADVLLYNDSTLENLKFSAERLTDVLVQLPLQVGEEKDV